MGVEEVLAYGSGGAVDLFEGVSARAFAVDEEGAVVVGDLALPALGFDAEDAAWADCDVVGSVAFDLVEDDPALGEFFEQAGGHSFASRAREVGCEDPPEGECVGGYSAHDGCQQEPTGGVGNQTSRGGEACQQADGRGQRDERDGASENASREGIFACLSDYFSLLLHGCTLVVPCIITKRRSLCNAYPVGGGRTVVSFYTLLWAPRPGA